MGCIEPWVKNWDTYDISILYDISIVLIEINTWVYTFIVLSSVPLYDASYGEVPCDPHPYSRPKPCVPPVSPGRPPGLHAHLEAHGRISGTQTIPKAFEPPQRARPRPGAPTLRLRVLVLSCCSSWLIWVPVLSLRRLRLACSLCTSSTSWTVSRSFAPSSASRLEREAVSVPPAAAASCQHTASSVRGPSTGAEPPQSCDHVRGLSGLTAGHSGLKSLDQ